MQDLILYIVKSLVTNPDAVSVDERNEDGQIDLILTVDPADMGLVIGKGGQTIKAIRKVLIVKAMADNVRVNLQLAEPEGGRPDRSDEQSSSASQSKSEDKETLPSSDGEGQQVSDTSESAEPAGQQTDESENQPTSQSAEPADQNTSESESTETPENRPTDQAENTDILEDRSTDTTENAEPTEKPAKKSTKKKSKA